MTSILLHELTWCKADKLLKKIEIALLPVGSIEQHGPHNPLGTDYLIAYALAREASKRTNVLCLPCVPFGISSHHRHFPGTISVSPKALRAYVKDILYSLYRNGIRKVIIINGHGGNLNALLEIAREVRERKKLFAIIFQWWDALKGEYPSEECGHAAALETSLNLYLHENLVDTSSIVDERTAPIFGNVRGIYLPWETRDLTKSGVMGVATTSNKEKGKEVFEKALQQLCLLIDLLKSKDISELLE